MALSMRKQGTPRAFSFPSREKLKNLYLSHFLFSSMNLKTNPLPIGKGFAVLFKW